VRPSTDATTWMQGEGASMVTHGRCGNTHHKAATTSSSARIPAKPSRNRVVTLNRHRQRNSIERAPTYVAQGGEASGAGDVSLHCAIVLRKRMQCQRPRSTKSAKRTGRP